jgi:hypothetical protein
MGRGVFRNMQVGPFQVRKGGYWKVPGVYAPHPMGNGTLKLVPFPLGNRTKFDLIGASVTVAATPAGALIHLGVYSWDPETNTHLRVLDAGTIDATSTTQQTKSIDLTLARGWYSLALLTTSATGSNPSVYAHTIGSENPFFAAGIGTEMHSRGYTGFAVSEQTALETRYSPIAPGAVSFNSDAFSPLVFLRRAS